MREPWTTGAVASNKKNVFKYCFLIEFLEISFTVVW
jgi:hypothetical protein